MRLRVTEQKDELWDLPSQRQLGRVSTRPQPQRCAFQMPQDPDELAVLDEIQQELILQGNFSARFLTPLGAVPLLTPLLTSSCSGSASGPINHAMEGKAPLSLQPL